MFGSVQALNKLIGALFGGPQAGSSSLSVVFPTSTTVASSVLEKSHVVSAAACTLVEIFGCNTGVDDLWLLAFNATSLPAADTAPSVSAVPVPAGSANGREWLRGKRFSTGCVVALSSTPEKLTLVGSNVGWFDAEVQS